MIKEINFFKKITEHINLLEDSELKALQVKINDLLIDSQRNPIDKKTLRQARKEADMNPSSLHIYHKLQEANRVAEESRQAREV